MKPLPNPGHTGIILCGSVRYSDGRSCLFHLEQMLEEAWRQKRLGLEA